MKMFQEFLGFSPSWLKLDQLLFQAVEQKGKGCVFLENLTEETMSCCLCIFLWLCLHTHTLDFSYFEWNSKGKRLIIPLFCPSSSIDFSWIPYTVMLPEYKGRSSRSCDWHLGQPFFCVEPEDGGQDKRTCQWSTGRVSPFLLSVRSSFLLPWVS